MLRWWSRRTTRIYEESKKSKEGGVEEIQTRSLSWLQQMAIGVQRKVVEGNKVPSCLYLI